MKILDHERKRASSFDFKPPPKDTDWSSFKHEAVVCYATWTTRVRNGMKPLEAAITPLKQRDNMMVWVDDVLDTRQGHCKALKINYSTVAAYMTKYAIDFESAVKLRLERMKK